MSPEGLGAPTIASRRGALEAFRTLLSRWPQVPPVVTGTPLVQTTADLTVLEVEYEMCRFYLQTFWEVAGRAATIPREFPFAL